DDVAAAALGSGDGVVGDGCRVAAFGRADEVRARTLRPDLELLVGSGAEGVRGGDDDGPAVLGDAVGELADGGRLPGAVDADDEDDAGVLVDGQGPGLAEEACDLLGQRLDEIVDVSALPEPLD